MVHLQGIDNEIWPRGARWCITQQRKARLLAGSPSGTAFHTTYPFSSESIYHSTSGAPMMKQAGIPQVLTAQGPAWCQGPAGMPRLGARFWGQATTF